MGMTFSANINVPHPMFENGSWATPDDLPEGTPYPQGVDTSNVNARSIMQALGMDGYWDEGCGCYMAIEVEPFRQACIRFLRNSLDKPSAEIESRELPRVPGQCRFIEGGRREGYLQDRVSDILGHINAVTEHVGNQECMIFVI